MALKRRDKERSVRSGSRSQRRLTGQVKSRKTAAKAPPRPKDPATGKRRGVRDISLDDPKMRNAWDLAEAVLYARVEGAPGVVDLLRERDRWLNPETVPILSQHLDVATLTQCAWQLAQGWTVKDFAHVTGLPNDVIEAARPEITYIRKAARALLSGILKTRMWVRGVVGGDVPAAKLWAELTETAPPERPRRVRIDNPEGVPVVDRTDRTTNDVLVRKLATLYQEERAVRDISHVPRLPSKTA